MEKFSYPLFSYSISLLLSSLMFQGTLGIVFGTPHTVVIMLQEVS